MKIVFCLHHFLPEFIAGTEIYTLRLAQQLQLMGNNVLVLIPFFDHQETSEYQYEGIRVIQYSETSIVDKKMIMGKKIPDGVKIFAEILIKERPDIIHFHEIAYGRAITIFHVQQAKLLNISIVLTCHLSSYSCFVNSMVYKSEQKCDGKINIKKCTACNYESKNFVGFKASLLNTGALALYRMNLNSSLLNTKLGTALGFPFLIDKLKSDLLTLSTYTDKIIVLTEWYKNVLIRNNIPVQKIKYIKQGLTLEPPDEMNNIKLDYPLKVIFIGRISKLKGIDLLIDAVCGLPKNKISLYIYGQENEYDFALKCKQKSKDYPNIKWMGIIPEKEVINTISKYHILCLPSTFSEMSPLVIQEAYAAGVPVLASNVYGNAEQIIDDINGWLFRFKDVNHLKVKLSVLMEDLQLISNAKLLLPTTYSFKEVADEHIKLYSELSKLKV